jgi:hypothetical protein
MRCTLPAAVALAAFCVVRAQAAETAVAVADFDYADSSGEIRDQQAAHAERLRALKSEIISSLAQTGHDTGVPLACAKPPCSADNLDQQAMVDAARSQHVRFVVFGGVHKISTLIQWGQIEVMDVGSGKALLSRTVSFRGDDEAAWQHAAAYIGQMVAAVIPG